MSAPATTCLISDDLNALSTAPAGKVGLSGTIAVLSGVLAAF
jgi:hypothetical protein